MKAHVKKILIALSLALSFSTGVFASSKPKIPADAELLYQQKGYVFGSRKEVDAYRDALATISREESKIQPNLKCKTVYRAWGNFYTDYTWQCNFNNTPGCHHTGYYNIDAFCETRDLQEQLVLSAANACKQNLTEECVKLINSGVLKKITKTVYIDINRPNLK